MSRAELRPVARYVALLSISLTPELENAVKSKVASGLYNNASEIIREALRQSLIREQENQWLTAIVCLASFVNNTKGCPTSEGALR